jgi:hypothetical protein
MNAVTRWAAEGGYGKEEERGKLQRPPVDRQAAGGGGSGTAASNLQRATCSVQLAATRNLQPVTEPAHPASRACCWPAGARAYSSLTPFSCGFGFVGLQERFGWV